VPGDERCWNVSSPDHRHRQTRSLRTPARDANPAPRRFPTTLTPVNRHEAPRPFFANRASRGYEMDPTPKKVIDHRHERCVDLTQSLLATRVRRHEHVSKSAPAYAHSLRNCSSRRNVGRGRRSTQHEGFLKSRRGKRLADLRAPISESFWTQNAATGLSNAVGYTNYPDNVVRVVRSRTPSRPGMDIFPRGSMRYWEETCECHGRSVLAGSNLRSI